MTGPAKKADKATYQEKPNTMYRIRLLGFTLLMRRPLISASGLPSIEKRLSSGTPARWMFYKTVRYFY